MELLVITLSQHTDGLPDFPIFENCQLKKDTQQVVLQGNRFQLRAGYARPKVSCVKKIKQVIKSAYFNKGIIRENFSKPRVQKS